MTGMSEGVAFDLLSSNGNLVKRPFLIGEGKVLVGFKEAEWEKAFVSKSIGRVLCGRKIQNDGLF